MADFRMALAQTLTFEGAYSNNPDDTGGETYCGISRVHNPAWPGWPVIDKLKPVSFNTPKVADRLLPYVEEYYRHLWKKLELDDIKEQVLAEEIFDISVNMGVGRAIAFLQEGLNGLNRDQNLWPDIKVDGGFGPVTRGILKKAESEHKVLAKVLIILRGAFYLNIIRNNPRQEVFIRGWLKRVQMGRNV